LPADVVHLELSGLATLCFDRSHFDQVLWNLLSNALRHSQRRCGSVRLLVRDASTEGQVEVHVIDDGEGVGEDCREQIFEPFFTTHHRGTGLGLYIARELCDANGPARPAAAGAGRRFSSSGEGRRLLAGKVERRPRGELARVLVVDDEADIRELLDLTWYVWGFGRLCGECGRGAAIPRTAALSTVPDRYASA
jgi:hypothetical protein